MISHLSLYNKVVKTSHSKQMMPLFPIFVFTFRHLHISNSHYRNVHTCMFAKEGSLMATMDVGKSIVRDHCKYIISSH